MESKTATAVKNIKELGNEVSSWEVRVQTLQNESASLQKSNEKIKREMESALALAKQELDKKRDEARAEMAKVGEAQTKLASDQAEFQGILKTFNKEKAQFTDERDRFAADKRSTEQLRVRLSNFALLVRRESTDI